MKDKRDLKDQIRNDSENSFLDTLHQSPAASGDRVIPDKVYKLSLEEKTMILKTRAISCAREEDKVEEKRSCLEVVEFLLDHEQYAIELFYIREVYTIKEITPLPCTPPFVLGIINLRGQILSVIDLKICYELPKEKMSEEKMSNGHKVIILHSDTMEFGLLVDAICGVKLIPENTLQISLPTLTGIKAEHLKGVTEDPLVVLDGGKILSDHNLIVYKE